MRADDPVKALQALADNARLAPELRTALRKADAAGVRLAALFIARLRSERLLNGCPEASRWFDVSPKEFAAAFRRYHQQVPPTAFFPPAEAQLFRKWAERNAIDLQLWT